MKRVIWGLLAVACLVAAFYLLSFRVMSSRMGQDSSVAASHQTAVDGLAVRFPPVTTLRVEGNGTLEQSLRKTLGSALEKQAGMGAVNVVEDSADVPDAALMTVRIKEQRVFWTPVYARAALQIEVAYSSNRDISFREVDPPHFRSSSEDPAVQLLGRYALADVSRGLISLPGYNHYLADQIVKTVAASMQDQMKTNAATRAKMGS